MSLLTSWAGLDPLIAAHRAKNRTVFYSELSKLVRRYAPSYAEEVDALLRGKGLIV